MRYYYLIKVAGDTKNYFVRTNERPIRNQKDAQKELLKKYNVQANEKSIIIRGCSMYEYYIAMIIFEKMIDFD
jgi:hypothetical protein